MGITIHRLKSNRASDFFIICDRLAKVTRARCYTCLYFNLKKFFKCVCVCIHQWYLCECVSPNVNSRKETYQDENKQTSKLKVKQNTKIKANKTKWKRKCSNHWQQVPHCDSQFQLHFFHNTHSCPPSNHEWIQSLERCFLSPFLKWALHCCPQWYDHLFSSISKWANLRALLSIAPKNNLRDKMHPHQVWMEWFSAKLESIKWFFVSFHFQYKIIFLISNDKIVMNSFTVRQWDGVEKSKPFQSGISITIEELEFWNLDKWQT